MCFLVIHNVCVLMFTLNPQIVWGPNARALSSVGCVLTWDRLGQLHTLIETNNEKYEKGIATCNFPLINDETKYSSWIQMINIISLL